MASKLLPQPTILALPRHVGPQQQPLRNLGFCASVSRNCKWGCRVVGNNASFGAVNKRCSSFVVRAAEDEVKAEDNAEDNKEEVVQADGEVEGETKAEGDVDAEDMAEEETRTPRKPRVKLGDIMGILNKRAVEASETERPIPNIRTGDVVEIKLEVPENRRRLSIYKGIVISRQNAGIHTTIRIRRIIAGIGVEIVFPLYSPNIKEIKVVAHRKVRRARLYYLRDKLPRLSTFK